MSDFGDGAWRKARKRHKCAYCLGPIPVGETYYRYTGSYDGEFQNWAMHKECHASFEASGDDDFMPGDGEMPPRVKIMREGAA